MRAIVLNGTGSVGKTSTARALQHLLTDAWLHIQMDSFLGMMPPHLLDDPLGLQFVDCGSMDAPEVDIITGPHFRRLMTGMRRSVAAMVHAGNRCIVDDIMLERTDQAEYRDCLPGQGLRFVGLHAPLEILEHRERGRGDRKIGLARAQFGTVHAGVKYDFECDTTDLSPREVASAIIDGLGIKRA